MLWYWVATYQLAQAHRPAESELSGKLKRWEHRARTAEIVRYLSRDHGLAIAGFIVELATLTAEEA
jgi:hypothetical protein